MNLEELHEYLRLDYELSKSIFYQHRTPAGDACTERYYAGKMNVLHIVLHVLDRQSDNDTKETV